MDCNPDSVAMPTNTTQIPCNGVYTSTDCAVTPAGIPFLYIEAGDSQTLINTNIVLAMQFLQQQIDDLKARVTTLES